MRLANPAGLALLALAVPVLLVHILRPRRAPVQVPSVLLWRRVERPVSAAQPWQRLRWSLLLLAQLLAVALLAVAVARPERLAAAPLAEHTVFIVDASGSMAATDGSPDRLADAATRARGLRGELPDGGVASVVVAGAMPRVALTTSGDPDEFDRAMRTIDLTQGRPDFGDAFALAESLQTGDASIGYVFLTDGGLAPDERNQLPPGTRIETVGSRSVNRAITRLSVEPRGSGLHARVTVRNMGGGAAEQEVRVDVDGVTAGTATVALTPDAQVDVELDVPAGDLVEAFLGGDDLLSADDHAVAVATAREDLDVVVVGEPLFWREVLDALPGVTVHTTASPDDVDVPSADLTIYNGVAVPAAPDGPFIAVAPPGGLTDGDTGSGAAAAIDAVTVVGDVERPIVTLVRTDDPVLAGLDLTDVAIATAQRVDTTADVLVAGEAAPLLVRGTFGGERFAYLTFAVRDSNLPVQIVFPLLVDRLVGTLTGTGATLESLDVGDRLPTVAGGAEIVGPDAEVRTVPAGERSPRASRAGFWRVTPADGRPLVVAVNAPVSESAVEPVELPAPPPAASADRSPAEQATSLLRWVLWPLLAVVLAETWLAWRRVGVSRRQWYGALALRAVVAALIVAAIVDPVIRRSSDRVATVFVLDASASVGSVGHDAAEDFVRAAFEARSGDAAAGVVVFGADAHVDQVVAAAERYAGTRTLIDDTGTDLAAGLRLGAALLPSDARRRVVLLSDGRATTGDVTDEVEALRDAGIPVDVVTLPRASGPDVAVAEVEVPRLARAGEQIAVTVHVQAATAGPATVVLRRDGTEIDRRRVELVAGANEVTFRDTADRDAGAVVRYQVLVDAPADTVAANDVGFAAVPIEGPARVLVVEGSPGEADNLIAALEAGGVGTVVVAVADIPSVQELITYAGIVLADVDARTLTGAQIDTLTTAVRDLGRGLVTIGGTQSYGVGGYRESPLSDLLPVDSEITDPQRRKTVAEVLSIDTSESMSNCHCADGAAQGGEIVAGGVNKTDISRAAAERTISALAATDQIGVLAWNSSSEWVIDLQQLPAADVVEEGLRSLRPLGATDIRESLATAAEALLESDAELRHIILFSDGFTDIRLIEQTADEAGQLYADHGITTSVLATGEGAAPSLEDIAVQGNGRFYAGTDLEAVPQIMAEEAVIASRDFVNEGSFLPEVTSDHAVVRDLVASPPLRGYIATSAKGQASTLLRIGPDRDPLLTTWQAGLGRVTSWTSDVNNWSTDWSAWRGFVDFWSRVVKDTLPAGDDAGAVQASVRDGRVQISVEGDGAFPDGAVAEVRVSGPDGQAQLVQLERTSAGRFEGEADAGRPGTYAVGATVRDAAGAEVLSSSTLAANSYPAEFVPGEADPAALARLAQSTGGRAEIAPDVVWDADGLRAGSRQVRLLGALLLAAALLWPVAVIVSRISMRGASVAGARAGLADAARSARGRLRRALPSIGGLDPDNAPAASRRVVPTPKQVPAEPVSSDPPRAEPAGAPARPPRTPPPPAAQEAPTAPPPKPPPPPTSTATVNDLLAKRRARRGDS